METPKKSKDEIIMDNYEKLQALLRYVRDRRLFKLGLWKQLKIFHDSSKNDKNS